MQVAVIGAGWAGLAAAIDLAQAGHEPTVYEAARSVGGRARTLALAREGQVPLRLDNGQHILIGAYSECLRLMRTVGVEPEQALLRLPLALQFVDDFPHTTGLRLPDLPPPWDALLGIARATGWSGRDKLALLGAATRWRLTGFRCAPGISVAQLCAALPPRLRHEFIEPLCVSALNTPAAESSAQVFLRVLRDSLFSGRGGSNLLLPRTDMGALFPDAAAQWLGQRGLPLRMGQRVQDLVQQHGRWHVDGTPFDAVVLAPTSSEAARLVQQACPGLATAGDWVAKAQALRFIPITTVYAQLPDAQRPLLPEPMLALRSGPLHPAQFVFDCAQLGGPTGQLAFVVSTSGSERGVMEQQVLAQAAQQLRLPGLQPLQTVVEKRATFACTPGLQRPAMAIAPGLWACGDYVEGPYPATLEGAVRSGTAVAQALAG
jgi:squalene-associated FAD-dependent desaturase